jgi:hypothetical protein
LETEKPHRPAFGFEPRPVAPSSRISPPEPVAAPGKRRDRRRVVVRLDLGENVRRLFVIGVAAIGAGMEARHAAPSMIDELSA